MHSVYPRLIRRDTIIHGLYGDVNLDLLLKRINKPFRSKELFIIKTGGTVDVHKKVDGILNGRLFALYFLTIAAQNLFFTIGKPFCIL